MQPNVPDKVVRVRKGRDCARLGPVERSVLSAEVAILGVLGAAEDRGRMARDRGREVSSVCSARRRKEDSLTDKAGLAM